QRPRGLAALGVAQIGRDHAELVLELVHRVEGVGRETRDRGVQSTTGDDQQREAGTDLLIVDADVALVVERHGSFSLHSVGSADARAATSRTSTQRRPRPTHPQPPPSLATLVPLLAP